MKFVYIMNVFFSVFFFVLLEKAGSDAAVVSPNQLTSARSINEEAPEEIRQDGDESWRVVGGSNAEPNQFPYIVSLRWNGSHICGGSILNPYWILTAAHCVYRPKARELSVSAGAYLLSEPGHLYPVARYIIHEEYDRFDITNDVAVVELEEPLIFSWFVHAIQMSTAELDGNTPCVLAGWGRKIHSNPEPSNHLQFVALKTLLHAECRRLLAEFPIQPSQVCTLTRAGEGACTGDSGGPLVTTDSKLIGMVSYGRPCAKGYPDVFTRISSFIPWINKHIKSA